MSTQQSPPKRPRLSLQIKAISNGPSVRTSRTLAAVVNPRSPTSFNTLSNVYSTAIDRSTPIQAEPVTAINTKGQQPLLRLQPEDAAEAEERRTQTPYAAQYPDTPLTAQPMSPGIAMEINFPSTMTATPPLSAGPIDGAEAKVFSFSPKDTRHPAAFSPTMSPRTPRRRTTAPAGSVGRLPPPYTHPRALHSILRNSPLPPRSARSPISPRRQSLRLQEKAARRVGYNNPLTQTITTNKYTKSHIDLLCEEASPFSPANPQEDPEVALDLATAYSGDETRDGGETPGPFEELRRRTANMLTIGTPVSPSGGIRKRKRKEKKRRWVWTIGQEDDEEDLGGAMAAIKAATQVAPKAPVPILGPALLPPTRKPMLSVDVATAGLAEQTAPEIITPSIEAPDPVPDPAVDESGDVEMSEACSVTSEATDRGLTPGDMDMDMITPTVTRKALSLYELDRRRRGSSSRFGSEDLINPETGSRRDTPIPADLLMSS